MKLTVLVDNNSYIDQYYLAEPALSFYLEDGNHKILFDCGYSDVIVKNAAKMGIDLSQIDTIVFSHGHNDHTAGLVNLLHLTQPIRVICHPNCDEDKFYNGLVISSPLKFDQLPSNFNVERSSQPVKISEHLTFLGQIERTIQPHRPLEKDDLWDDTALVYQSSQGIAVITGCSHSGICNIIEQAKKCTNEEHITSIIGGFHLLNDPETTSEVCTYLSNQQVDICYPCHCTDLNAKIAISQVVKVSEVGVSLNIELK